MSIFAWIGLVLLCVLGLIAGFVAGVVGVDLSSMIAALLGPLLILFIYHAFAGRRSLRQSSDVRPLENSQRSIV